MENGFSKQTKLDLRYLRMARIWAENSYCKRRQVGALVVKDKMIISDGYNGTPSGFENICEENDITKPYVLHAEANAITKLARSSNNSDGSTLYVTASPCIECAKLIIQAGIKRVVYAEKYRLNDGIQLMEERNTLITLMAKGFLEPALFNQERNVLDSEMKNLSTEKTNLVSNSASGVLRANEIKDLINYVSADNFNGDYTEELFEEFVVNIIVNSRDELTFNLKCGLSLKEKVVR